MCNHLNTRNLFSYWNYPRYFTSMMLAELNLKEHDIPLVHIVKNMKHNNNHQTNEQKHIDNGVHASWVMSPGLVSGEWRSLHSCYKVIMNT